MKMRRLLSLKWWSNITRQTGRFIASPEVSLVDKLLFAVPVLLYWVLPDVMPFVPIDDIGVTMLLMGWFTSYAGKKYPAVAAKKR